MSTSTPGPQPLPDVDPGVSRWRRLREPLLIGALALVLNLAGNGGVGLWDRDEPRYAVCVREMRAAERLGLSDLQRRAALSQADLDLLADAAGRGGGGR